jgi:hypothetical protein
MVLRARASNARYREYLAKKKQDAEEAEKQKALKEEHRKQLESEKVSKQNRKGHWKGNKKRWRVLRLNCNTAEQQQHSVLKTAEALVKEAEQKLSAAMKNRNMDQVAVALL